MISWPLLSVIIFMPFVGGIIILFVKEDESTANNIKWSALLTSIGVFILSLILWLQFDYSNPFYQFEEKFRWFADYNFFYHIGVDGISLFMILLSTFLIPICILASWNNIKIKIKEYMLSFLFLETVMIGMFASIDILLFYIFLKQY